MLLHFVPDQREKAIIAEQEQMIEMKFVVGELL